jgi:hypothetical protein
MKNLFMNLGLVAFVLAALAVLGAERLEMPALMNAGVALVGAVAGLIGLEAIVMRRIAFGTRSSTRTYTGLAAIAQGLMFELLAAFFIGMALLSQFGGGRDFYLGLVRRPGWVLIVIGGALLLGALTAGLGPEEGKRGGRFAKTLDLLFARLLPGVILLLLGAAALGLGALEIVAPAVFDALGGGFIESLYQGTGE